MFVVELADGREILIDAPHTVAMGGTGACFMSADYEFYTFEEVRDIRLTASETAA